MRSRLHRHIEGSLVVDEDGFILDTRDQIEVEGEVYSRVVMCPDVDGDWDYG